MKKCNNCGADLDDNVKFCTYCGSAVPETEKESSEYQIDDPGLPIQAEAQQNIPPKTSSQPISKIFSPLPFIAIGLVVFAFIFCKVPVLAIILGIGGFVLSIIAAKKKFKFRVFAIIGIPLAIIAILVSAIVSGTSSSQKTTSNAPKTSVESTTKATTKATETTTTRETATTAETTTVQQTQTETTTVVETEPPTTSIFDNMTMGQKNAVKSAQSYLSFMSFSRAGLFEQLTSEYGDAYSEDDANFAIYYLEEMGLVNWSEQAVKSAQTYIDYMAFSRIKLYEQLTGEYGEKFTDDEAGYAIDYIEEHGLVNWYEEAVEAAKNYLEFSSFSRDGLYEQLTSQYGEAFTSEEAEYALEQVGY